MLIRPRRLSILLGRHKAGLNNRMTQSILIDGLSIWQAGIATNEERPFEPVAFVELSNLLELLCLHDDFYTASNSSVFVPLVYRKTRDFLEDNCVLREWPDQKPLPDQEAMDEPEPSESDNYIARLGIPKGLDESRVHTFYRKCEKQVSQLIKSHKSEESSNRTELFDLFSLESYLDCCLVEICSGIAYHPSLSLSKWYFESVSPGACRRHDALIYRIYCDMRKRESRIHESILDLTQSHSVTIPPIAAIVLARSKKPTEIWPIAMELRDELHPLRTRLGELIQNLKNPDIVFSKKVKKITRIKQSLTELSKRFSHFDFLDSRDCRLGIDPHKIFEINQVNSAYNTEIDYDHIKDILFKVGLEKLRRWFYRRSLKEFFKFQSKLDRIKDHGRLIRTIWNHDLTQSDINTISKMFRIQKMG